MTSPTHRPVAAFVAMVRRYDPGATLVYATDGTREIGERARHDEWERAAQYVAPYVGDDA